MSNRAILTIKETAKEFNFPEFAIRTLVKKKASPVIRVGNRSYITREIFDNFIKSGGNR